MTETPNRGKWIYIDESPSGQADGAKWSITTLPAGKRRSSRTKMPADSREIIVEGFSELCIAQRPVELHIPTLSILFDSPELRRALIDAALVRWVDLAGLRFDQANVLQRQLLRLALTCTAGLEGEDKPSRPSGYAE
jgi:hypothetical protein